MKAYRTWGCMVYGHASWWKTKTSSAGCTGITMAVFWVLYGRMGDFCGPRIRLCAVYWTVVISLHVQTAVCSWVASGTMDRTWTAEIKMVDQNLRVSCTGEATKYNGYTWISKTFSTSAFAGSSLLLPGRAQVTDLSGISFLYPTIILHWSLGRSFPFRTIVFDFQINRYPTDQDLHYTWNLPDGSPEIKLICFVVVLDMISYPKSMSLVRIQMNM